MNSGIRIKSLNGNTFTETVVKDGKTFINVYDEDGNLIDVMEEVASAIDSIFWFAKIKSWLVVFSDELNRIFD